MQRGEIFYKDLILVQKLPKKDKRKEQKRRIGEKRQKKLKRRTKKIYTKKKIGKKSEKKKKKQKR